MISFHSSHMNSSSTSSTTELLTPFSSGWGLGGSAAGFWLVGILFGQCCFWCFSKYSARLKFLWQLMQKYCGGWCTSRICRCKLLLCWYDFPGQCGQGYMVFENELFFQKRVLVCLRFHVVVLTTYGAWLLWAHALSIVFGDRVWFVCLRHAN